MATSTGAAPRLAGFAYEVQGILGTSGNSTVMKVSGRELGGGTFALRAIKRTGPEDDLAIEWARAECEASAKLQHPSILKVHDSRVKKQWLVIVDRAEQLMEFVDGKPLDQVPKIRVGQGVLIFSKVAAALAQMHRREVLHGDIRPRKILLARNGQVKLRGYGYSLVNFKYKSMYKPSGSYVAPERAKEPVATEASDIYALGATMYHVLSGRAPAGLVARTEGQKLPTPQAINAQIPNSLNTLIVSCLQLAPDARPKDAYEVSKKLEEIVKQVGINDEALVGLATGEGR